MQKEISYPKEEYNDLILHYSKCIVANPNYQFSSKTKQRWLDHDSGQFKDPIAAIFEEAANLAKFYLQITNRI